MRMKRNTYRLLPKETHVEGGFCHVIEASYRELRTILGPADLRPVDDKVSTQWKVEGPGGRFLVYDYKATRRYARYLPGVHTFRQRESYFWHVGGNGHAEWFVAWLKDRLAELRGVTVLVIDRPDRQAIVQDQAQVYRDIW